MDAFLDKAPEGCLKWQNKNGKTYYAHQMEKEGYKSKWIRKYIKKNDVSLAKALAQKHYYLIIRPILEKNLKELRRFLTDYKQSELEEIYDGLCDERKRLVNPIRLSVKEKISQWKTQVYEKNMMYPENLQYETDQGDMVRSKSEVIIANMLYQKRNHILYKYERPLEIMQNGRMKTIYPDFTIINLSTGKVMYWEHAGRMDDMHYANEFVKKINLYISNGLIIGKDVIVTYETSLTPLDIHVVKCMIRELLVLG